MSIQTRNPVERCDASQACGAIEKIVHPSDKELGGFSVRRALPTIQARMVGPWIFFDHMGPAEFAAGTGIDVRPHPHIGIATVTYLFEGEILHRDSLGNELAIRPGDINLMVAGRGIVHSERETPNTRAQAHRLHALQLWLALPEADEEIAPAFHHYPSAEIPALTRNGVALRVMMGQAYGVQSPVRTFASTLYVEAELKAGDQLTLPMAEERAIYVAQGQLHAQDSVIEQYGLAILHAGNQDEIVVRAERDSRIAIIGGEPVGKRYIEWNFVSSSKVRIAQAKQDWRDGRFPKVRGDENAYIPLPE